MRSFTCLTALTLALALGACGGEGDDTTTTNTTKTTPSTMSDGTTTAATDGTTTEPTTSTSPTTTDETTTAGPTTDPTTTTDGTTTAATDGTTTDGTTTAATDGTTTGGGGDLYGPCEMGMPPCPDGQACLSIMGVEGNFCSPTCDGMSCPAAPAGAAGMPTCALTMMGSDDPVNCAIICMPDTPGQCPEGSTCKPIQGVGICTFP